MYDSASERNIIGFDITDADGTYTISVPNGDYKLFFYDSDACGEQVEASTPEVTAKWHSSDVNTFAAATVVTIEDGNIPPVNIVLTGLVTGTVTSGLGGQAIPGICVEVYDSTTELSIIGFDITDADGIYTIGSIAKDYKNPNYKLFFYDSDACGERVEASTPEVTAKWYGTGATNFVNAASISVTGDGEADIILTGKGTVKGTLSGGTDLSCVMASLYDTTDFTEALVTQPVTSVNTYSFPGLITTPVYTLKFVSDGTNDCTGLASEWYGGIPVSSDSESPGDFSDVADTFTVGAGATVTIDATLEKPGTVSGKMISERSDMPIVGASIRLYPLDAAGNTSTSSIEVMTDDGGTFKVGAGILVAGNYKLEAPKFEDAASDLTWDGEWWEDAAAQDTATVLVVAVGADTALTGPIDRHGPGALTGTVTDGLSGNPVAGAIVTLHLYNATTNFAPVGEPQMTDADGSYDFRRCRPWDVSISVSAPPVM